MLALRLLQTPLQLILLVSNYLDVINTINISALPVVCASPGVVI